MASRVGKIFSISAVPLLLCLQVCLYMEQFADELDLLWQVSNHEVWRHSSAVSEGNSGRATTKCREHIQDVNLGMRRSRPLDTPLYEKSEGQVLLRELACTVLMLL